jgi:hypothetical protein
MEGHRRMAAWLRAHPGTAVLIVLSLCVFDWIVADRWGIEGNVSDADTGAPLNDVFIFSEFDGEEPLLAIPFGPDPAHRIGKCMGVRLTRSDQLGHFEFDTFTSNRPLANKTADILVFKPGWLTASETSGIASSIWSISPELRLVLKRGPGRRQMVRHYEPNDPQHSLPAHELSHSDELFDATGIVVEVTARCGTEGLPMAVSAMKHALQIAETYDERDLARSACGYARKHAPAESDWPFECRRLSFQKAVSAAVLAVEAQLPPLLSTGQRDN